MSKFTFTKFVLAIVVSLRIVSGAFAQTDLPTSHDESVLCYKTTTKEVQKLFSQVDYEKIATHELLRTKVITYKKAFRSYFDENGEHVNKYRYEYHYNLFPNWHIAPDEVISDHEGTHQVFTTTSTIYKGGWFGHDYELQNENAFTTMDLRYGYPEYTYHVAHDADSYREYYENKQTLLENGLVFPFKYLLPTEKELTEFESGGYTIIQNEEFIKVFNRDVTITWYVSLKKVVYEFYENYQLVFRIQRFFEWNEEINHDVIVKEIETTPYTLSTGDCAESEITTVYSDYAFGCSEEYENIEIRESQKSTQQSQLTIFPNPANDVITLTLQRPIIESDDIEIMIYNSLGSLVYGENTRGKMNPSIYVQKLPAGAYYLSIQINNDFYSNTFIKN